MNVKRVRWRIQQELDSELRSDFTMSVKKEPVLPMQDQDRTEWLLWCCFTYNCTMQEANHRYKHNLGMMKRMADNINLRRKLKRSKKGSKRFNL